MSTFLAVGGVAIPVAVAGAADVEYQDIGGEVVRAYAGSLISSVKARARVWRLTTTPLAAGAPALAALRSTAAVTCTGDYIGGAVSCRVRSLRERVITTALGRRWVVECELHEVAP
jgi:hypothetical protein